jgi:hypothetical protein
MLRRLVVLAAVAAAAGALLREIAPDIRRYLKLREM